MILTPIRAPNANAHTERVIETIREWRRDRTLISDPHAVDVVEKAMHEATHRGERWAMC